MQPHPETLRLAAIYNQPVPLGQLVKAARVIADGAERDLTAALAEEPDMRGSFDRPLWRAHVLRLVATRREALRRYNAVWNDFLRARDVLIACEQAHARPINR